jgi:dihydrofolate reductase
MNLIVAVDNKWAIGNKGDLLISIPEDMKFFRNTTMGKVVVMGKNTLESFPNSKPLKNRVNIVIALEKDYEVDGAITVHSIEEALEEVKKYNTEDVFVIGGGSIYKQMLQYCDTAYITYIDFSYEADTFIPNLDEMPDEWYVAEESNECTYFDLIYYFRTYKRK